VIPRRDLARLALAALATTASCAPGTPSPAGPPRLERWGFAAPWDARSAASVRAHAGALDAVLTGWIALDTLTGAPLDPFPDSVLGTSSAVRRMAIVSTTVGDTPFPATIRRLAMDSSALARVSSAVAARARRGGYRGIVLDFAGLTRPDSGATRLVVATMSRALRSAGVGPVIVAVPGADTAGYPARYFDGVADLLLLRLHDQHWATSPPGALAAPDWVRRTLGARVAERGASRLAASLPLYGYLWRPNAVAETIGYDDAVRLAAEAGVPLARDPATATLHAVRPGADGWELWVSDAELVATLEREAATLGVRRVAYWRLGFEDPALWRTGRR
jgi:spore germination protein